MVVYSACSGREGEPTSRLQSCTEARKTKKMLSGGNRCSHNAFNSVSEHLGFCLSRCNLNCFSENISGKLISVYFLLSSRCTFARKCSGLQRSDGLEDRAFHPDKNNFLMQSLVHNQAVKFPRLSKMPFQLILK